MYSLSCPQQTRARKSHSSDSQKNFQSIAPNWGWVPRTPAAAAVHLATCWTVDHLFSCCFILGFFHSFNIRTTWFWHRTNCVAAPQSDRRRGHCALCRFPPHCHATTTIHHSPPSLPHLIELTSGMNWRTLLGMLLSEIYSSKCLVRFGYAGCQLSPFCTRTLTNLCMHAPNKTCSRYA